MYTVNPLSFERCTSTGKGNLCCQSGPCPEGLVPGTCPLCSVSCFDNLSPCTVTRALIYRSSSVEASWNGFLYKSVLSVWRRRRFLFPRPRRQEQRRIAIPECVPRWIPTQQPVRGRDAASGTRPPGGAQWTLAELAAVPLYVHLTVRNVSDM